MTIPVAPGDVLLGKYRIEQVLGQGGMGIVVAAHHIELGQRYAIKFLLPTVLTHEEAVERFLREARASARLQSEHVARKSQCSRNGYAKNGVYQCGAERRRIPRSAATPATAERN